MIDHFNEIELLSVLPSVLQGSLASSSNHCSIFKICEKKKKVIIHKNGDHMPLVLIGSHFQTMFKWVLQQMFVLAIFILFF